VAPASKPAQLQAFVRGTAAAESAAMRFLPAFVLVGALAGCDSATDSPQQSELESALETWNVQGPADYSFTWQQYCECTTETTQPIRITVVNNVITDAVYVATQQPVSADIRLHLLTVDGVFDELQDAVMNGADAVSVEYDPNSGIPLSVAVDYDAGVADEELSLILSDFHSNVAHDPASCGGPGFD
jgi:hypothetical protein